MRFSTILTALFCPYIAHELTAQNLILSVRSLRFARCTSLFLLSSAIAPKIKVRSRAKSDWAISKSDMPSSTNHTFLCVFQPFLVCSFVLISHMSELLRIWILSVCSLLFFLLSTIAPKIKVRSRAIERFQRAMCPALLLIRYSIRNKITHHSKILHTSCNHCYISAQNNVRLLLFICFLQSACLKYIC